MVLASWFFILSKFNLLSAMFPAGWLPSAANNGAWVLHVKFLPIDVLGVSMGLFPPASKPAGLCLRPDTHALHEIQLLSDCGPLPWLRDVASISSNLGLKPWPKSLIAVDRSAASGCLQIQPDCPRRGPARPLRHLSAIQARAFCLSRKTA